jgi:hypothetical protein
MTIGPNDSQRIAYEAAHVALEEFVQSDKFRASMQQTIDITLERMGVDTLDPEAMRRDMIHLRTWREFMEFAQKKGIGAAITWTITGLLGLIVLGVMAYLHR